MLQEGLKWLPTAGTKLTKPRPRVHIFAELCTAEGGRGLYYGMPQTLTFSSGTAEEEETRRLPLLRIAQAISPRSLTALATLNLNDLFLFARSAAITDWKGR